MGMTAEEVARRYAVTREEQDAFAAESQRRAEVAVKSGVFDREIVAVDVPQRKGPPLRVTKDEYPRAGTTAADPRGAAAGVHEGWHGDGRQRVRDQRRRRSAGDRDGEEGQGAGAEAARTDSVLLHDRRGPEGHGHGPGAGDAKGGRAGRAVARRSRPRRTERSVRLTIAGGGSRARPRSRRRSTSTAARSRSVIRSAPAAPASSPRSCTPCRRAAAGAVRRRCASAAGWAPRWSSRRSERWARSACRRTCERRSAGARLRRGAPRVLRAARRTRPVTSTARSAAPTSIRIRPDIGSTPRCTSPPIARLRGTGREVVGVYHSHPHSAAVPSPTDCREAHYPGFIWVIVSLAAPAGRGRRRLPAPERPDSSGCRLRSQDEIKEAVR